ncbi:MAG TPA: hypothetical protein VF528_03215 [Pyrinomonadaceae bacterium]|jgi:hypothetical protein
MTKEEALQFKARWRMVDDFNAEEARRAPLSLKLHQLALMYEAAQVFGWAAALKKGEEEVRERWRRLKELYHV